MELVLFCLADWAEVINGGRLALGGAAPEWWSVAQVPGPAVISGALVLGVDSAQPVGELSVTLRLVGDEAGELWRERVDFLGAERDPQTFAAGALHHLALALTLHMHVEHVGGHRLEVLDTENHELGHVRFGIRLAG